MRWQGTQQDTLGHKLRKKYEMEDRPTPKLIVARFCCSDAHYAYLMDIQSIGMCREGSLFSRVRMSEKSRAGDDPDVHVT